MSQTLPLVFALQNDNTILRFQSDFHSKEAVAFVGELCSGCFVYTVIST